jgi:transposase InsO family protein
MKKATSLKKVSHFNDESATERATGLKDVAVNIKINNSKDFQKKETWLTVLESATLLNTTKRSVQRACKKRKYITKAETGRGGTHQLILLSSLPSSAQVKYWNSHLENQGLIETAPIEDDMDIARHEYDISPQWRKDGFDKNFLAYRITEHVKGKEEIEALLSEHNKKDSIIKVPESYQSICRLRVIKSRCGYMGFFPNYGKNSMKTLVQEEWLDFYCSQYLSDKKPSVENCWRDTVSYFINKDPSLKMEDFPRAATFDKQLKSRYSPGHICLKRDGEAVYNRRFGNYVERDYSNTKPGECYVSDHAQLDVAVKLSTGKICFPWVTSWVDFRTGKWLGWNLHTESPNSDHIFQTFFYSVDNYGIPHFVYIDNGKDYRSSDFSGGRKRSKKITLSIDEGKSKTALEKLGTEVIFANPYGPQAKSIIERSFLKVKERFSKFMVGYRGGNTQERPEGLEAEIKQDKLMTVDEISELFDRFIANVLNKMPAKGKLLNGMCPDELWEKERIAPRVAAKQSLALACMRKSKAVTIIKNGVWDSKIGHSYWGDWMDECKGRKVYLLRDPKKYQEAWVFSVEDNDSFLGMAYIGEFNAPAITKTDADKAKLEEVITRKKRSLKLEKAYFESREEISNQEKVALMERYAALANEERGYTSSKDKPKVVEMVSTPLDNVTRKIDLEAERIRENNSKIISIKEPGKEKPFPFWCDRLSTEEWEEKMRTMGA